MPTAVTRDAFIEWKTGNLTVPKEIPSTGTVVTGSGSVGRLNANVSGKFSATGAAGAVFELPRFTFTGRSSTSQILLTGATYKNAVITGTNKNDLLILGGPTTGSTRERAAVESRTTASLLGGNDSITFTGLSTRSSSTYDVGTGSDSITFARGAKSNVTNTIRLGNDAVRDVVSFQSRSDTLANRVTITQFRAQDQLKVGTTTYTQDQLKARGGKLDNIIIKFD